MWAVDEVSRRTAGGAVILLLNLRWEAITPPLKWDSVKLTLPNNANARAAVLNAFRRRMERTRDALLAVPPVEKTDQVIEDSLNA